MDRCAVTIMLVTAHTLPLIKRQFNPLSFARRGLRLHEGRHQVRATATINFVAAAIFALCASCTGPHITTAFAAEGLHEPFKYAYSSKHFSFYTVTNSRWSKYYADYLEDFLLCVNDNFVPVPANFHMIVYLYPDAETLNLEGCATTPRGKIGGRHNSTRNAVFTYDTCGVGLLSHELMHKIVHENFKELEPWANEGVPTLFENLYGYRTKGGTVLYLGYQSPRRIKELGESLTRLSIRGILDPAASVDPYQESDKQILATFLIHENHFAEYVKLAQTGEHQGFATLLEGAFKEKISSIEPRFKKFTTEIMANKKLLLALPDANYFDTKEQFEAFEKQHADSLRSKPAPSADLMRFQGNKK